MLKGLRDVVIVSFARTPIGSMGGTLASVSGPLLGAAAIRGALKRAGSLPGTSICEVIMGNVISAGLGQAPARQAARGAGIHDSATCFGVNKVCASGMKAVALGAANIAVGASNIVVAGGFESMSGVPYYAPGARSGLRLGHSRLIDGVIHDGLWDPYGDMHMGSCAEKTAKDLQISRADQDAWALRSYTRAKAALARAGPMADIESVLVKGSRGAETVVSVDEEPSRGGDATKLGALKPAFLSAKEGGTITAANASKLNDGAAALVLMDAAHAKALGLTPIARVLGYADAEAAPIDFSSAPSLAVPRALARAGVNIRDVALHEINEAFSSVVLANIALLNIDADRVNINGGAVAMGHPIGASGARIIGSLITALGENAKGGIGVAAICNGGGGASAFVVERL